MAEQYTTATTATPEKSANKADKRPLWLRYRYMVLRRLCQFSVLMLFWLGPLFGLWLIKGNLSASTLFSLIPLNEPFSFTQTLLSGFIPTMTAWIGVAIVIGIYLILSGRTFCGWVCPVNLVTDFAAWVRDKLGIRNQLTISERLRHYFLFGILLLTLISGEYFYANINPVHTTQRALIFMMWMGLWPLIVIFCLDAFISKRAWCSHLCPMGAFYRLLNIKYLPLRLRVLAPKRSRCDFCMDCVKVCPEPKIIMPVLKDAGTAAVIDMPECTNCARCVEVCHESVFSLSWLKPGTVASLNNSEEAMISSQAKPKIKK